MFKKGFTALLSLGLATLVIGCNQNNNFQNLPPQPVFLQSTGTFNTDWYDKLRPDLKEYYAEARGKTGEALFHAIHNIIARNNNIGGYQDAKSYMYDRIDNIEVNNRRGIVPVYSQIFVEGKGGNGNKYKEKGDTNKDGYSRDFINCEHIWPQSFFNKRLPMRSDIHHLVPTLSIPNNRRGHYPFGEVQDKTVVYNTSAGSKLGATSHSNQFSLDQIKNIFNLPYEERAKLLNHSDVEFVFEPTNPHKGNTARAMFYFFLRYYNQDIRSGHFDDEVFWDSKISTFIRWHELADPVDEYDIRRNDLIFEKQGNRNPFIDIPELPRLIGERVFQEK